TGLTTLSGLRKEQRRQTCQRRHDLTTAKEEKEITKNPGSKNTNGKPMNYHLLMFPEKLEGLFHTVISRIYSMLTPAISITGLAEQEIFLNDHLNEN
ncbi:MAG TPA: hypothetical protein VJ946_02265, partial [Bacteroidales bacterium]|nr:hypothetical protein [Bacteroidales bacterium]